MLFPCWIAIGALFLVGTDSVQKPSVEPAVFQYPCDGYLSGIRGKGNFGKYISRAKRSPFAGSYHLAEDVWVDGGTKVFSVADGRVVYSDFSPTWTDPDGHMHWNLGNVIVVEHQLPTSKEEDLELICSVYVHLAADRRVQVGDQVTRGQLIGFVGANKSEENGRYPEHLHFGLHRGPYLQISPAWQRSLIQRARDIGLPCGQDGQLVTGEIKLKLLPKETVQVEFIGQSQKTWLSLLVGSTSPGYQPADIAAWCQGYGDKQTIEEWIRPSKWIREHLAPK